VPAHPSGPAPAGAPPEAARAAYREGESHAAAGRWPQAATCYERALAHAGDFADAHLALGLTRERMGEREDALDCFQLAVHHGPALAPAHYHLGRALAQAGDAQAAVAALRAAVALAPDHAEAHCKLAALLQACAEHEAALYHYREALRLRPDWVDAQCNAAAACNALGRYEEGRDLAAEALRSRPALAEAAHNLGLSLLGLGRADEAAARFSRALELKPTLLQSLSAAGHAARDLGRFDEALAWYDRALALDPAYGDALLNRCYVHLLRGDFAAGWREYERRFEASDTSDRGFPYPRWNGEAMPEGTLLIYAEQGLGDEILFASCLPDAMRLAGRCVIECNARLASLYRRSFPGAWVHGGAKSDGKQWLARAPAIDAQIPIGSLPLHLRSTAAAFPAHRGYLRADPQRTEHWRWRLQGGGLAVGISWRGGTAATRQRLRSLPLEALLPALAAPGVRLVSLQYGDCCEEVALGAARCGVPLEYWPEALQDLDDTAALIAALDLVISVDNTTVHLSGALGRPVWVLLAASSEWRYLAAGERMPWYPSARLYRQSRAGDWRPVLDAVARDLSARAGG
jgi:tetratricopeptide (TPR) repeat protein